MQIKTPPNFASSTPTISNVLPSTNMKDIPNFAPNRSKDSALLEKKSELSKANHRVRNNLQMVSSLISLHGSFFKEPAAALLINELRDRIQSIALVHEHLHETHDSTHLSLDSYIRALLESVVRANSRLSCSTKITMQLSPVKVSLDMAVPLGLILNELINNAVRHAFSDRDSGEVSITLLQDRPGETVSIEVKDNGKGMPDGFDWRNSTSLGMSIVKMLTRQIEGTIELGATGLGTAFLIKLPPPNVRLSAETHHV